MTFLTLDEINSNPIYAPYHECCNCLHDCDNAFTKRITQDIFYSLKKKNGEWKNITENNPEKKNFDKIFYTIKEYMVYSMGHNEKEMNIKWNSKEAKKHRDYYAEMFEEMLSYKEYGGYSYYSECVYYYKEGVRELIGFN